jgi:adenylyltransferase/sulfurtransferase
MNFALPFNPRACPDLQVSARAAEERTLTPELGDVEARRLQQSRVLLVGAGGLGSPVALALGRAGVGSLVLVDFDRVDVSNLQRQILFDTHDVGRSKLQAAAERLSRESPALDVVLVEEPFSLANAARLVADADLVIDGADNFPTRYLVNDACVLGHRMNVFGSVSQFDGQVAVFGAPGGPCYRCLHPEPPPDGLVLSCAEGGVLGVLPGVVGALQALEAVKLLAGIGTPLIGRLLLYDALRMRARDIALARDPDCPVCGDAPAIRQLQATGAICEPAGPDTEITSETLAEWRADRTPHRLVDVREPSEHAASSIDGALLVPLGRIEQELDGLRGDRPVVVFCRSGARSARAVRLLRSYGIDARSLSGGIENWQRAENLTGKS